MLNEIHCFLKREFFKTRDVAVPPVGYTITASIIALALGALVIAGVAFAIVKIVKIMKKKHERTD